MISAIHGADEHAPFPHRVISGSETVRRPSAENGRKMIEETRTWWYITCAICHHLVTGSEQKRCECRASCHAAFANVVDCPKTRSATQKGS